LYPKVSNNVILTKHFDLPVLILGSRLTDSLKNRAMEICGEEDRFRGDKIAIAPLQISTELPSVEKAKLSGHGHRREDIASYFRKEPQGNVLYTQLFEEVKRRVEGIPDKNCSTVEAEKRFLVRHGNLVVISGQPGIGKSTLTKHMVEKMWKSSLNNPDIVFFIRFRDVDYTSETDLLQFLAPFVTDIPAKEDRIKIMKKIVESDRVFIIMDGLDEATIDPKMNQPESYQIETIATAERFIQNLIAGNILPHSKKLITSRPYRLSQLPKEFHPKVLFTIQGLDEIAFAQICSSICNNDTARCDKIITHLQNHPDLKSYCHTPVICIMVMESLNKMFAIAENSNVEDAKFIDSSQMKNVDTLTSIFVFVLTGWLLEKLERTGKFQIKNISSLASKGFKKDQFYFREFDLKHAGVNFYNTTAFLNAILKGTKIMYFVHLMWQEFLVAVNLRLYTNKEQFVEVLSTLDSAKFEIVSRFLFGLCNEQNMYDLLDHVENLDLNSENDREECEEMLKQFAIEKLRNAQEPYFETILPILGWVREFGDEELTKQAASCLKDEISIDTNQIPSDIPSVNHVLRARETHLALIVLEPYIVGNYLQYFIKELHKTLTLKPNIQVMLPIITWFTCSKKKWPF